MPTFGVGSFRIIVKRDHDADIVLSGMNEDQYPNRTFLSVLWKTKIFLRIMKIFAQSILGLFLFCFVLFFNNNNNNALGSRKISNHLLTFWFPAMMLNSSNNFITLSQTKQISWESDQNPIGFTAEFDWLRKGCNHSMRLNQLWITMNTQFKIIPIYITIKNRYKDILIHMVLTLITAWRQRRTFSRTFNDIDLKNALVRKNYSLGNWV